MGRFLFQKHKENGHDQAEEGGKMVPLQGLSLEHDGHQDCKYGQGDHLLNDFQLHEVERTAVFNETDPVRRHLGTIFEECHSP